MAANLLDLNSDCSESEDDCDYVPSEEEASPPSGGENDSGDSDSEPKRKKAKRSKKKLENEEAEENIDSVDPKLAEEKEKKHADDLWKDFLEDVKPVGRKITNSSPSLTNHATSVSLENGNKQTDEAKKTVTEELHFAGEKVIVNKDISSSSKDVKKTDALISSNSIPVESKEEKPQSSTPVVSKRAGGLSSLVGSLGKKKQISTLHKSFLDWNKFKKDEGIEEDLRTHNKGKGGYIERQSFLQRSDVRQFEIERDMRMSRKAKP